MIYKRRRKEFYKKLLAGGPQSTNASHLTTGQVKIFVHPLVNQRFCYGGREPLVKLQRNFASISKIQRILLEKGSNIVQQTPPGQNFYFF